MGAVPSGDVAVCVASYLSPRDLAALLCLSRKTHRAVSLSRDAAAACAARGLNRALTAQRNLIEARQAGALVGLHALAEKLVSRGMLSGGAVPGLRADGSIPLGALPQQGAQPATPVRQLAAGVVGACRAELGCPCSVCRSLAGDEGLRADWLVHLSPLRVLLDPSALGRLQQGLAAATPTDIVDTVLREWLLRFAALSTELRTAEPRFVALAADERWYHAFLRGSCACPLCRDAQQQTAPAG
eukprot:TRINITY_DN29626_c0_g1_i1.p1 TRINITY_DN29626_c0_g1~~TRINITY_DN29626_c0_g1_i1.p1  ORF type:complete len:273 (+),score=82.14 TRINITY_DN29626_c0_g1_i1:92-820(+)